MLSDCEREREASYGQSFGGGFGWDEGEREALFQNTHLYVFIYFSVQTFHFLSHSRSLCVHSYDHDNVDNECGIRETTTLMMMMEKK
jgi:hypothetical protein